jgi:hypothetical protein
VSGKSTQNGCDVEVNSKISSSFSWGTVKKLLEWLWALRNIPSSQLEKFDEGEVDWRLRVGAGSILTLIATTARLDPVKHFVNARLGGLWRLHCKDPLARGRSGGADGDRELELRAGRPPPGKGGQNGALRDKSSEAISCFGRKAIIKVCRHVQAHIW